MNEQEEMFNFLLELLNRATKEGNAQLLNPQKAAEANILLKALSAIFGEGVDKDRTRIEYNPVWGAISIIINFDNVSIDKDRLSNLSLICRKFGGFEIVSNADSGIDFCMSLYDCFKIIS